MVDEFLVEGVVDELLVEGVVGVQVEGVVVG